MDGLTTKSRYYNTDQLRPSFISENGVKYWGKENFWTRLRLTNMSSEDLENFSG